MDKYVNTCNVLITFLLLVVLFKNTITAKGCTRKEDCSTQLEGWACSFCVGEAGSAECIYPFPEQYIIDENTLECKLNTKGVCKTDNPCKNYGKCQDIAGGSYVCECKENYVGRNCETKNSEVELFYLNDLKFKVSVPINRFTDVEISYLAMATEGMDEYGVKIMSKDSDYASLKYELMNNVKYYSKSSCKRTQKGVMRYKYKPYDIENTNFLYLGKTVIGYFTNFQILIVYKGKTIFNSEFKIFVFYPENNNCVPIAQLTECGVDFNKPTIYNRRSQIRISSSLEIIPYGNSRNPYGEGDEESCGRESDINLTWKIWWLRAMVFDQDTVVLEKVYIKSINLNPMTDNLMFGTYRIELEAKNVCSEGSTTNYATCYFKIETLPLEAIIEGGTRRSVAKKDDLLMSAVNSRDPNQRREDQSIMTRWRCTALNQPAEDASDMCKPVTLKSIQPYLIPAVKLSEGEYNFTLTIWSAVYFKDCDQCETAQRAQQSYQIVVITNKTNLLILCEINCGKSVTVNNELILKVSYLDNAEGLLYNWTCLKIENDKQIPLPIPIDYPKYIFKIPEGTLENASRYIVSVTLTVDDDHLAANYNFETDDFIYSGNCSIVPPSGIRGITYFDIQCSAIENKALVFEFYDRTSKEASENVYMQGRMLGTSNKGELQAVILTRGVLVVYIICGYNRASKTYEINLKDDDNERDALLNNMLHNPLYFQKMPFTLLMQHISAIPDIITNNYTHKALLDVLMKYVILVKIKQVRDVKLTSLLLFNVLSRLSKENMDLSAVQITRKLAVTMTNILEGSVQNSVRPTDPREVKETIGVILNVLELSLTVQNKTEVDGTYKYITTDKFFDLTQSSDYLEEALCDIQRVLSILQNSGLPPTNITSDNNYFAVKVLKDDAKYNYSLSKLLKNYLGIPVSFSNILMNRLQKSIKVEEKLSLCIVTVNKNIFEWFYNDIVSNIQLVYLSKHTKKNNIINLRQIASPVDMEMHFNHSLTKVKEHVSQTISVDPSLDEDSLDLQIRVHRLDPAPNSKLTVTFLYPPTNVTLRVLVVEDYRPTYQMMMTQSSLITQQSPYYSPSYTNTKPYTFYYMGVLPGPGISVSQVVNFSFVVNSTKCVSWERVKWSSTGCNVGPNTSGNIIHCQCNHLSVFGAIFPFLPNQIDPFADAKLFLTVVDNPLVVSAMVVILVIYILFSILFFHMDKNDRFRGTITPLEDNFPHDTYAYVLAVYTSSRLFSGTSANVGVQLIGELANSRAHILKCSYYQVLSRHSDDWFLILCPRPLGFIRYLHLWHDNTGISPGWYCDKVHVYDIDNYLEGLFIVEQWIVMDTTYCPEALVLPASRDDILKIQRVFSDNISKCMQEQRFITGILTQHPRNTVRRVQRLNIFMCSLLIALLCSIMFYTDISEVKPDDYEYNVDTRDLYVSFLTVAVIVAVNFVINLLFQKSYTRVSFKTRSSLYFRRSEYMEEYFEHEQHRYKSIFTSTQSDQNLTFKAKGFRKRFAQAVKQVIKSQNLAPAVLPNGDSGIQVKTFWLTFTWILCAIIIFCCIYFIMLYGLKMGLVKSKEWLSSLLISFANDRLAINPLSVIVMAATITATFGFVSTSSSFRATKFEIHKFVAEIQHKDFRRLVKKRQHPMYSPIKAEIRRKITQKKLKSYRRIQVVRLFLSLCYIIVLVSTVQKIRSLYFCIISHLETMIKSASWGKHSVNYLDAYDVLQLGNYVDNTFLKIIYTTGWYNTMPLSHNGSSLYWTSDYSWKMVGVPHIRQQRVHEEHCHSFAPPLNRCISYLSAHTEETDNYDVGWSTFSSYDMKKGLFQSPWSYTYPKSNWLKAYYRLQGVSNTVYNDGGYNTRTGSSIQETFKTIAQLFDNSWVDMFTKVVFVDLTLYNVNVRSFSHITLITEFLTTGVSLKIVKIAYVAGDCEGIGLQHIAFIALTLLFSLDICYQINYNGPRFFKDIKNILLAVIVIPSFVVVIAFLTHVYDCVFSNIWERHYQNTYEWFDFDTFVSFRSYIALTLSVFLVLSVWRLLLMFWPNNLFVKVHKLVRLSQNIMVIMLLVTLISLSFLFEILLQLDILSRHTIIDLIISQKKPLLLRSDQFSFETVILSFMKFCTLTLVSSLFVTSFVHFHSMSQSLNR